MDRVPAKADVQVRRITVAGLVVNTLLCIAKAIVGWMTGSRALIADAVHSMSDSITDIALIIGVGFWMAPADDDHPYGHGRIEALTTLAIGLALGAVAVGLGWDSLSSLQQKHESVPGWGAFGVAIASIMIKEILYQVTARRGRKLKSKAMVANAWHHRSDAMSSVPVAAAVLANHLLPAYAFLDHIAAIIVCVMLLGVAWKIMAPCLRELIDAGADAEVCRKLLQIAHQVEHVKEVHGLRSRHVGPGLVLDLHVLVDPNMTVHDGHNVGRAVRNALIAADLGVVDVLIHLEPLDESAYDTQSGTKPVESP